MRHHRVVTIVFFLIFFSFSCFSFLPKEQEAFSINEEQVYIHLNENKLSFVLPKKTWDTASSNYQKQNSMVMISFTRTEAIFLDNTQSYYPTLSVITEKLFQETDAKSYDEYVRKSVETAGMSIEIIESLKLSELLPSEINGTGWKILVRTSQGDSILKTLILNLSISSKV